MKTVYPYDETEGDLLGNEEYLYDDIGRLAAKKDGNGDITAYAYDDLDRLTDVYYNYEGSLNPPSYEGLTADVTYTYYGGSSLKHEMTTAGVGTSHYDYDIQGRLTSYTPPVPSGHDAVEYTYNNLGQKTSVESGDYDVEYDYYANGWLKDVKTDGGTSTVADYTYNVIGMRTNMVYGNDASTDFTYVSDSRHMLSSITHNDYTDAEIIGLDYTTRDYSGNPTLINSTTYTYDANSRLTAESSTSFGYDWVGNRLNPPANPNPMVYNAVDQLTSWPGNYIYTYYDDGNLSQVRDNRYYPFVYFTYYSYHPSGLLYEVSYPDGELDNAWDATGNRVGFTIASINNSGDYTFVYDVTAGIPAVIEEGDGETAFYYYREPNGALIARRVGATGGTWRYYHFDELGSTRALTDEDGDLRDTYTYDAWGNVTEHTDTTEQPYQYVGRLGYYTHYQDPNFKLLQLGVRFYDPEIGRFTQTDQFAQITKSSYSYADNKPVVLTDPSGYTAGLWQPPVLFPSTSWPSAPSFCAAGAAIGRAACEAACLMYSTRTICNNVCKAWGLLTCPVLEKTSKVIPGHQLKTLCVAIYLEICLFVP